MRISLAISLRDCREVYLKNIRKGQPARGAQSQCHGIHVQPITLCAYEELR